MNNLTCVLWFVISCFGFIGDSVAADLNDLPPLFQMDNYKDCKTKHVSYCHVKLQLKTTCNSTNIWKNILDSKENLYQYPRDLLFRAVCIPKELFEEGNSVVSRNISREMNKIVQNLSLEAETLSLQCRDQTPHTFLDTFILFILVFYFIFILVATLVDFFNKNIEETGTKKIVVLFSLLQNWNKFIENPATNSDVQKPLQGMRSFAMLITILGHIFMSILSGYTSDFKYIEKIIQFGPIPWNIFINIVQVFFIMSSWLLAIKVQRQIERKNFELNQVFTIFLARICRLMPILVAMILLHGNPFFKKLLDGPFIYLADKEYNNCQQNSWTNLLFVNNYLYPEQMCNITAWYVAADTQMYAISLLLLYIIYKFKLGMRFLGVFLLLSFILHVSILYSYNLGAAFIVNTPLILRMDNVWKSKPFSILYTSTFANSSTYILGLCFGTIYCKYKNQTFFHNQYKVLLWIIAFFGLPLLVSFLMTYNYSRLSSAIIGALFKPLFAFGIGIGLFGLNQNIGGIIQKIFEHRLVQLMAKITYTTYIFHGPMVFLKLFTSHEPLEFSNFILVYHIVCDVTISLLLGLIMHLMVEQPWTNVQVMVTKALSSKEKHMKKI